MKFILKFCEEEPYYDEDLENGFTLKDLYDILSKISGTYKYSNDGRIENG